MTRLSDDLGGITTPLVTPFDGGDIDWTAWDDIINHVINGGADCVLACGTTGESDSLTADERRETVERVMQSTPSDGAIVVCGTGTSVPEAVGWIETVADIGVNGVVVTVPDFHTSNGQDGLRRFFRYRCRRKCRSARVGQYPRLRRRDDFR